MTLPELRIGSVRLTLPIVQGGMGVGVSNVALASAVSRLGGLGTLSSACLDRLVGTRLGRKVDSREAAAIEVADAKKGGHPIAINIMVALVASYGASVMGALDAGADVIVSGAGLPLKLPAIVAEHPHGDRVALVPIVSSARALDLIGRRWDKAGRRPDAVILEGPMAGGHLGWKTAAEITDPANRLEALLPDVLESARALGGIPVIVAGGIYTHEDILRALAIGASGVQIGTRFLATVESGADPAYKRAVVECTADDIVVATDPGSPCGLPFRTLSTAPMYAATLSKSRAARCDKHYLLMEGRCPAKELPERYFCICNGLLSSTGLTDTEEPPLYTVGANAHRIEKLLTVEALMKELAGTA